MILRETYATERVRDLAAARGLALSLGDWRAIFLAITDEIAMETTQTAVRARLLGPVRDGAERWRIRIAGHSFDVIYEPTAARITNFMTPAIAP